MRTDTGVDNRTPMIAYCSAVHDDRGRPVVLVIVKMTYEVAREGQVSVSLSPSPIRRMPEYGGRGASRSLRHPSDVFVTRPGTDLLVHGDAVPENGDETAFDVSMRVRRDDDTLSSKTVRVHGPRRWTTSGSLVVPEPATRAVRLPLVYEHAFGGGGLDRSGQQVFDLRNPVGSGFDPAPERLVGRPAPRIEDPACPVEQAVDQAGRGPDPAGFAPRPPGAPPYDRFGGTRDATWAATRAPIEPTDFDARYRCTAPVDQRFDQPLCGDEVFELLHIGGRGLWRFRLPAYRPVFVSVVRRQETISRPHLDTVIVDATAGRVELVWRAAIPIPRFSAHLEMVSIFGEPKLPETMLDDLARQSRIAPERREEVA